MIEIRKSIDLIRDIPYTKYYYGVTVSGLNPFIRQLESLIIFRQKVIVWLGYCIAEKGMWY
jgi:hypothetical protein